MFAWEYLTDNVLGLDPEELYVTVHTDDDEAQTSLGARDRTPGGAHLALRRRQLLDDGPDRPVRTVFRDCSSIPARPTRTAPTTPARTSATASSSYGTSSSSSTIAAQTARCTICRASRSTPAGLRAHARVVNGKTSMYDTDLFTDLIAAQPDVGARRSPRTNSCAAAHHRRSRARGDVPDRRRRVSLEHRPRLRAAFPDPARDSQRPAARLSGRLHRALAPAVVASLGSGYPELTDAAGASNRRSRKRRRPSGGRSSAAPRCSSG